MDNNNKEFTFNNINEVGKHKIIATYKPRPDGPELTADVVVEMRGPNLRSTENEEALHPHLFFKTSDNWFLNSKEGDE